MHGAPGRQNRLLKYGDETEEARLANKKAKTGPVTVKVALLGFGTVGSSVAKVLAASKFPGMELTHIFNRNVERKRSSAAAKVVPASVVWTENIEDDFEVEGGCCG